MKDFFVKMKKFITNLICRLIFSVKLIVCKRDKRSLPSRNGRDIDYESLVQAIYYGRVLSDHVEGGIENDSKHDCLAKSRERKTCKAARIRRDSKSQSKERS